MDGEEVRRDGGKEVWFRLSSLLLTDLTETHFSLTFFPYFLRDVPYFPFLFSFQKGIICLQCSIL